MSKWSASLAGLGLIAVGAAWGQAAAPASAASAGKPPMTEAQAAMERAQRLAANPMRVILQAGKIRRRAGEGEPEVADPAILRRTAVRADAPVAPAVAAPRTPTPTPGPATTPAVVQTAAQTAAPTAPAPQPTPVAPPPEPPPSRVLASLPASTGAASAVPAIETALPAETAPALPKAVAPTALPIAAPVVQPTLTSMVDPDIPARLMADGVRVREIFADLMLRADGTVAEVKLVPPVPRGWQPFIVTALEQWRFEPLPSARLHRVQLIFEGR